MYHNQKDPGFRLLGDDVVRINRWCRIDSPSLPRSQIAGYHLL